MSYRKTIRKDDGMNKQNQNDLNWIRIPCGMHIGTVRVSRPSRIRGIWNRVRKSIKRTLEL